MAPQAELSMTIEPPVHPREMVRREDPPTSHEAAYKKDHRKQIWRIFEAIRDYGDDGCISDDLQELFGISDQREGAVSYSGITGYFAKLVRRFYIEAIGERDGFRFGRAQTIWRALPEEERQRRQAELDARIQAAASPENVRTLEEWWHANTALQEAQTKEMALRQSIVDAMLPTQALGKYCIPLDAKFELIIELKRARSYLTVREMSKRRLRELAEDALEREMNKTAIHDTDNTTWRDEFDG